MVEQSWKLGDSLTLLRPEEASILVFPVLCPQEFDDADSIVRDASDVPSGDFLKHLFETLFLRTLCWLLPVVGKEMIR